MILTRKNSVALMVLLMLLVPLPAVAHTGHDRPTQETEPSTSGAPASGSEFRLEQEEPASEAGENLYSVESPEKSTLPGLGTSPASPLSRTDLAGRKNEMFPTPAPLMDPGMNPAAMDHGSHEKMGGHDSHSRTIELAKHKPVPTSAPGYGVAVGITLLSALVFGALSFMRPGE
ncbi:MAG: hypothetical protein COV67_15385 [Nitrospinae bacterium CG11_big_fil_rev_8_21_14_0_20_56_8]|nr:MAG: hypothetical protein COV67_15385 [Nitrospinae bacterium CG11_big_fil_rev_8_21_14_0_20_56_8]